jgi:hypothetical protein
VYVGPVVMQALRAEVERARADIISGGNLHTKKGAACPFCPFRAFKSKGQKRPSPAHRQAVSGALCNIHRESFGALTAVSGRTGDPLQL